MILHSEEFFRLCSLSRPTQKVRTQDCLNQTLLTEFGTGIKRFDLESRLGSSGNYYFNLQLPSYTCENCVLQWWYNVGKYEQMPAVRDVELFRGKIVNSSFEQSNTINYFF